jgi:ABC-type uncharacterized transport system substrate-binding protein
MSLKEEEEASPKLPQASQHDSRLALCGSSREREEAASDRNTCTRHDSSAQRLAVSPIVFGWDARARIFRGPRLRHSRPSSRIYRRLVRLNPDVILAGASAHAIAAKLATSTIPIVVPALGNPIALGLIETDARPGENLTGIMPYIKGLPTKQIELAREIVPPALKIGIVNNSSDVKAMGQWDEIEAAAPKLDIKIASADVRKPEDIEPAFKKFEAEHVEVVVVLQSNLLILERARIATAASATRLPTVYGYREHVETGGLISYGVNLDSCFRRAATYVYKILKGTPAADLPVEFPTKLELVINTKTAKAIGIELPTSILLRADELLE